MDKKVVTQSQVDKFARENGFIHYSFCSVKEGKGISEPMRSETHTHHNYYQEYKEYPTALFQLLKHVDFKKSFVSMLQGTRSF